jgi:hypothetical protein
LHRLQTYNRTEMAVLKRLDFLEEVMVDELFSPLGEMDLLYYASDIMEKLGCEEENEIDHAIRGLFKYVNH